MENQYSKESLLTFLDFVGNKGLLTKQNAQNWKVATAKILDDLAQAEQADVRKIDIDTAFHRFANRTAGQFSPNTLSEYRRRATLAIQNFVEYANDPAAYKPLRNPTPKKIEGKNGKPQNKRVQAEPLRRSNTDEAPPAGAGLAMAYPLRENFLAQIVIPRDMSVEEARRMSAFIMTLAKDFKPTQ
jgi:hypothetical protein